MADAFSEQTPGLNSPASRHVAITPNDSADLDPIPRAIRVGVGGNIVVRDKHGTDITYTVVAGEILSFRGVRILNTGTTASSLVGWD